MRTARSQVFVSAISLVCLLLCTHLLWAQDALPVAPAGWTVRHEKKAVLYVPPGLAAGEVYSVTVYPGMTLGGRTLDDALADSVNADPLPPGSPSGSLRRSAARPNAAGGVRLLTGPDGRTLAGVYTLLTVDGRHARLSRVVFSGQGNLFARFRQETFAINSAVADGLKAAAKPGSAKPGSAKPGSAKPSAAPRPIFSTTASSTSARRQQPPAWIVAPGRGLRPASIAAVVHFYDVRVEAAGFGGLNTEVTDAVYLLLTDGTVHKGLPAAPDQFDAAASRRGEPQTWGRWKRVGGAYLAAWHGSPLQPLRGTPVLPAGPDARLAGRWGTGSSSADIAGSSYRLWGVTFTQNGRFKKDGHGGSGNSLFMQSGGQPVIGSEYDDHGSYTTVQGGSVAVGTGHSGPPESHRSGTYSLNGYTLTLRYGDGRIERSPFFFGDAAHKTIWFEGAQLARGEEKP